MVLTMVSTTEKYLLKGKGNEEYKRFIFDKKSKKLMGYIQEENKYVEALFVSKDDAIDQLMMDGYNETDITCMDFHEEDIIPNIGGNSPHTMDLFTRLDIPYIGG